MITCYSGGAKGADQEWGEAAALVGFSVNHLSFAGHRSCGTKENTTILSQHSLNLADPFLIEVNKTLKRKYPTSNQFVNNLLRRNYYQVKHSKFLYAITTLDKDGMVNGGTAWAAQMFLDDNSRYACFVFDQDKNQWFTYRESVNGRPIEIDEPPFPTADWTGIGTREINITGIKAIHNLLKNGKIINQTVDKVLKEG